MKSRSLENNKNSFMKNYKETIMHIVRCVIYQNHNFQMKSGKKLNNIIPKKVQQKKSLEEWIKRIIKMFEECNYFNKDSDFMKRNFLKILR